MPDDNQKEKLLKKIKIKRSEIHRFLKSAEPRNKRLINIAIVCGAIAAALTAGPAFGGKTLTGWLTNTLELTSPVWQLLCLAATVCSVSAVIVTNISKSHGIATNILRAQTCNAKLEGLETLLEMEQVELNKATTLYTDYLNEISFL